MKSNVQTLLTLMALVLLGIGAIFFALNEAHRNRVITTDSIVYVDTARHIAEGKEIRTSILNLSDTEAEPPQTQYPPFYPMLMSPLIRLGIEPIYAGRVVSAVAFGLAVLVIGIWLWRLLNPMTGLATAAVLTTLPSLSGAAAAVWADALYTLIVVVFAAVSTKVLLRPTNFRWFVFGSLVGIAIFTKFLGIILIGAAFILIIFFERRYWRESQWGALTGIMPALLSLLGTLLFTVPLLARNYVLGRPIGGAVRHLSDQSLSTILGDLWSTLSKDFTANWWFILLLLLTGVSLLFLLRNDVSRERFKVLRHKLLTPLILVILTYLVGLVVTRWFIDTDPIHTRFLIPVYPLITITMVTLIAGAARSFHPRSATVILVILTLVSVAWTVKAYDFSADPFRVETTSRIRWVHDNTTRRDLLIGDHSPEYNLILERSVLRLGANPNDQKLTPELLETIMQRWRNDFDRLFLTLTPDLYAGEYGQFTAALSRKEFPPDLFSLVHEEPKLIVLEINKSSP